MNKLLIALLMAIVLVLILPYFYVPGTIRKRLMAVVPVPERVSKKVLLQERRWLEWWPEKPAVIYDTNVPSMPYNGYNYRLGDVTLSGVNIYSTHNGDSTKARLIFIPIGQDSTAFAWEYDQESSFNPVKRMLQYNKAKILQTDMSMILQEMSNFLMNDQRIYHIKVDHATITDSLLVTTKAVLTQEPDAASVYQLVDQLQQYIAQSGATATKPPMLHQSKTGPQEVEIMVALPVNKVVGDKGAITFKRMVPGNILVTEVQGGPGTVKNAFDQLEKYRSDHRYTSPAIPFESLVTNRLQEPDTSKWVTRICYPIF